MRPVVRQQGFYVAPGETTLVSVKVEETFTTPQALSFFPAAARKCYQDDIERPVEESEFQPKYFNRKTAFKYTMDNCLYTSMIDKIMTNCNCTPNFAIIGGYHSVGYNQAYFFQLDYWKVHWTPTEPHPFLDAEEHKSPVLRWKRSEVQF